MTRYYLHLRNGTDELLDHDGRDFWDLIALRKAVLLSARDLLAGDVMEGTLDFRYRIDAEDETGAVVDSMRLEDAVIILTDTVLLAAEAS